MADDPKEVIFPVEFAPLNEMPAEWAEAEKLALEWATMTVVWQVLARVPPSVHFSVITSVLSNVLLGRKDAPAQWATFKATMEAAMPLTGPTN